MKYLAIDYGLRRIGVAGSVGGVLAEPLCVVVNKGEKNNLRSIGNLIVQYKAGVIVMGVPLDRDGAETPMSQSIRVFGEKLGDSSGVEVIFVNERYSSKDAEEHIRINLGITKPERIKELVDKMAAAMVLQLYLDNKRGK